MTAWHIPPAISASHYDRLPGSRALVRAGLLAEARP
jgi:hypothetical protein